MCARVAAVYFVQFSLIDNILISGSIYILLPLKSLLS